jgi:hypothetical protein
MSVYGYGTYGMGYRYPRRKRQFEAMKTFIRPEDREDWAKAAIFNRASVSANPWVKYLEDTGVYETIGQILRDARTGYYTSRYYKAPNAEQKKRMEKALENRKKHLQEEIDLLKTYQANPGDLLSIYQTKKFATEVPYSQAVLDEIEKLENQLRALKGEQLLPTERKRRILERKQQEVIPAKK